MIKVPDFEALYRRDADPWQVASSFYEQRKLDLVLAALSRPTTSGPGIRPAAPVIWPPGSRRAAGRSWPPTLAAASVKITRRTCAGLDNVVVRQARGARGRAAGRAARFDLVVVSEFLYYLNDDGSVGRRWI